MKIVHIAPHAPYNDNWGYQENILPKYQKKLGHEVTLIITNTMHKDGKIVETDCADYMLDDGVRVIRRAKKKYAHPVLTNMYAKMAVFDLLCEIRPDYIFFHGLGGVTIYDVIRYKKEINSDCVVVQDNHLDYNIGTRCTRTREKLIRAFHRNVNKKSVKYVEKIYGVTPWRKTYVEDYYKIPPEKTDVLIMGADDEKIDFANRDTIRKNIREQYGVNDGDFLVVTGGKIDTKKKIHLLMKACAGINGVKLLVFGNVSNDLKEEFDKILCESKNIIYIGWIEADSVYNYYFAADLVFFPGQHSVLWEQACASKVPCVFEKWEGMDHVDNGGNSDFISPVNEDTLKEKVSSLLFTEKYYKMNQIAKSEATDIYLYSNIAKKSLECVKSHEDSVS